MYGNEVQKTRESYFAVVIVVSNEVVKNYRKIGPTSVVKSFFKICVGICMLLTQTASKVTFL